MKRLFLFSFLFFANVNLAMEDIESGEVKSSVGLHNLICSSRTKILFRRTQTVCKYTLYGLAAYGGYQLYNQLRQWSALCGDCSEKLGDCGSEVANLRDQLVLMQGQADVAIEAFRQCALNLTEMLSGNRLPEYNLPDAGLPNGRIIKP